MLDSNTVQSHTLKPGNALIEQSASECIAFLYSKAAGKQYFQPEITVASLETLRGSFSTSSLSDFAHTESRQAGTTIQNHHTV